MLEFDYNLSQIAYYPTTSCSHIWKDKISTNQSETKARWTANTKSLLIVK